MSASQGFEGFPEDGIQFFTDIKNNNNREWFAENKQRFIEQVQEPAIEFVIALGTRLQALAPEMQFDTAKNGSGSVMRIYRDTRFSKDKTPFKDWVGIGFWGGPKKSHHSGVYFGFSDDGGGMHVGSHNFSKEFLAAFRKAVADEMDGEALRSILEGLVGDFTVRGEQLKRVPPGFDKGHPREDLLKYKSLYVSAPSFSAADLQSPRLVGQCVAHFETLLPFHRWLYGIGQGL